MLWLLLDSSQNLCAFHNGGEWFTIWNVPPLFIQASGDESGRVTGSYSLTLADGRTRTVTYVADENGYRAEVTTNEVGTESKNSADVIWNSSAVTGHEAAVHSGSHQVKADLFSNQYFHVLMTGIFGYVNNIVFCSMWRMLACRETPNWTVNQEREICILPVRLDRDLQHSEAALMFQLMEHSLEVHMDNHFGSSPPPWNHSKICW